MFSPPSPTLKTVTAVILAGGGSTRMGGQDKSLLTIAQQSLLQRMIGRLHSQVERILINSNHPDQAHRETGLTLIADAPEFFAQGPLAGMQAALAINPSDYLFVLPCDCTDLPHNIVQQFLDAALQQNPSAAVAWSDGRMQPVFALIQTSMLQSLETYLRTGKKNARGWFEQIEASRVDFAADERCFQACNSPTEYQQLKTIIETIKPS